MDAVRSRRAPASGVKGFDRRLKNQDVEQQLNSVLAMLVPMVAVSSRGSCQAFGSGRDHRERGEHKELARK